MTTPVIRLEFKKFGGLKYISHLDLQRAVLRFIKRAGIPIRYTEGFNPHPKLVFGLTMSVGMESECELVDIYLAKDTENPENPIITPDEFVARLSSVLPNGLEIAGAYFPETSFSDIDSAEYIITLYKKERTQLPPIASDMFSRPVEITKKTKSGIKAVDISPLVMGFSFKDEDEACVIHARLAARQNEYLNPDHFVKALLDGGWQDSIDFWQVLRVAINFKEK